MTIGIFDSGLGGLTVLAEIRRKLPLEDLYFVADTLHVPYGTKQKEEVRQYILEVVADMMKQDLHALVIACNTATSIVVEELRELYPDVPIIGMEPAVKPAVEMNIATGKRVLVFATPLTLSLPRYYALVSRVDEKGIVDSLAMEKLVPFSESLNFDSEEVERYFEDKLATFELENYGIIVLGCTHYAYFKPVLERILPPHIQIVDGTLGTVRRLTSLLHRYGLNRGKGKGSLHFHNTSLDDSYTDNMKQALAFIEKNEI